MSEIVIAVIFTVALAAVAITAWFWRRRLSPEERKRLDLEMDDQMWIW